MRLQDLKHLETAMEAFTACVDVDMLLGTLLAHTRDLFHMEAAFLWLAADGEQSRLHRTEGVPASAAARLQRLKMSARGGRAVASRLHKLGYRAVLVAPLQVHGRMVGMVAAGSQPLRPSLRIDSAAFNLLVRCAASALERLQPPSTHRGEETRRPMPTRGNLEVQNERLRLLNTFISGITHDLNNALTTISGRMELLLNRLHDQVTLQHLGAAHRAIDEASQMIRHIHGFVSGYREGGAMMVDINQLVAESIQMARSAWFQGFRQTHIPVALRVELNPVPAFPTRPSDLRIAFLCLLRHAMDTLRPGGELMVRTSCVGEDGGQTVVVSISDDPGQPSTAVRQEGIGFLLRQIHTPESQLALEFVQTIIRNLDGQITVDHRIESGTTTTLLFSVRRAAAGER
jgi:signal transduction histidine kinase